MPLPHQITIQTYVDRDLSDRVRRIAARENASVATVARAFIALGVHAFERGDLPLPLKLPPASVADQPSPVVATGEPPSASAAGENPTAPAAA